VELMMKNRNLSNIQMILIKHDYCLVALFQIIAIIYIYGLGAGDSYRYKRLQFLKVTL
jgi:hypothetical protein